MGTRYLGILAGAVDEQQRWRHFFAARIESENLRDDDGLLQICFLEPFSHTVSGAHHVED